jgi:hypothetical protein
MKTLAAILCSLLLSMGISGAVSAETLFLDDFEQDTVGEEPSKWEFMESQDGREDPGFMRIWVEEDPIRPNNKVLATRSRDGVEQWWAGDLSWNMPEFVLEFDFLIDFEQKETNFDFAAMQYRCTDWEHQYHYNYNREGTTMTFWIKNGGWQQLADAGEIVDKEKWWRTQVNVEGDSHIMKVKEVSDNTPFSGIKPIMEVEEGTFDTGAITIMGSGMIDNVEVYVGESTKAVDATEKLAATWGLLKSNS